MSATPMNNEDYVTSRSREELKVLEAARADKGLTYTEIAEQLGVSKVFLASAFDGQQILPDEYASKLAGILDLPESATSILTEHPFKGNADPLLYRLHEAFDTYGPAIKRIIEEEFDDGNGCGGNGIMSAIDFAVNVERKPDPKGDRVIITFDGKFLPYSHHGQYPW